MAAEEEKAHGKFKDEKLTAAEAWVDVEKTVIPELGYAIKNSLESLEGKCEFYRESQDSSVQHIVKRIRSVYNLVRKLDHLPATSPIIGLLCDVMQSLYRFLGNPYHVNSMLLRAKSQKVTLKSNVFHRRLDELLDLLAPKVVDSIHTWKQQAKNGTTQDSSGTPQPVAP
ncbi:Tkl protein kinase, partial [Globisporangium polare]